MDNRSQYTIKSNCHQANVLPDPELKQLVCETCRTELGDSPWNNEKITVTEK